MEGIIFLEDYSIYMQILLQNLWIFIGHNDSKDNYMKKWN